MGFTVIGEAFCPGRKTLFLPGMDIPQQNRYITGKSSRLRLPHYCTAGAVVGRNDLTGKFYGIVQRAEG